jgi:preprotein translocase subunit SecE
MDTGRLEWPRGVKTVKDFLVVITFLAMVLVPAFAALNVFSPKKNRF